MVRAPSIEGELEQLMRLTSSDFHTSFLAQLHRRLRRGVDRWTDAPESQEPGPTLPALEGPVLGNLVHGMRDPVGLCMRALDQCGPAARIPMGIHEILLFNHPAAYERVLVENWRGYGRGLSHKILATIIGQGMLTAENDDWVETRRAAGPRLSKRAVADMQPIVARHLGHWLERFEGFARRGETRALALDFMALTSQIGWEALFGYSMPDAEAEQFTRDFIGLQDDVFTRLRLPLLPPRPVSLLRLRRIEGVARRLRRGRRSGQLGPQTMTLLATAPENPSNTIAWACFLLARHPEHAAQIRRELAATGESARLVEVVHETMRLYPGGWLYERHALEDDEVAGYRIRRGSSLVFCPYTMHRNSIHWPEPERFDPGRFRGQAMRALEPYTYVPFSVGPRRCAGDRYTMGLVLPILAGFLARFEIVLDPEERGELWPMFTLRAKTGIRARLESVAG